MHGRGMSAALAEIGNGGSGGVSFSFGLTDVSQAKITRGPFQEVGDLLNMGFQKLLERAAGIKNAKPCRTDIRICLRSSTSFVRLEI